MAKFWRDELWSLTVLHSCVLWLIFHISDLLRNFKRQDLYLSFDVQFTSSISFDFMILRLMYGNTRRWLPDDVAPLIKYYSPTYSESRSAGREYVRSTWTWFTNVMTVFLLCRVESASFNVEYSCKIFLECVIHDGMNFNEDVLFTGFTLNYNQPTLQSINIFVHIDIVLFVCLFVCLLLVFLGGFSYQSRQMSVV